MDGECLKTDMDAVLHAIKSYGPEAIAAVLTTTSCFSPRGIDEIEQVVVQCLTIIHLLNIFLFYATDNEQYGVVKICCFSFSLFLLDKNLYFLVMLKRLLL